MAYARSFQESDSSVEEIVAECDVCFQTFVSSAQCERGEEGMTGEWMALANVDWFPKAL